MFNNNVSIGASITNFNNNHRIVCVDIVANRPVYFGFIGTELMMRNMNMREALEWLNQAPTGRDTICPVCKKALFTQATVVVAPTGQMFCSGRCAKKSYREQLQEQMQAMLDNYINDECEISSTSSVGIRK